jgi:glutathione S-transferase
MPEIILHHYPTSPFSEKIRAILGYKQLAWKSVFIPTIMPKPDLTALTGGYRKTPVMQIGRDIYCDSKLMVRVLERLHPQPALFPKGREADCLVHEQWTEQVLFFLVVPIVFQPAGLAHFFTKLTPEAVKQFQKDRESLFTAGNARRGSMAVTRNELPAYLQALEAQLTASPFLLGGTPSVADFSTYHPLWFLLSNPGVASYLDPYPYIRAWAGRIAAFGHGQATKMSSEEALEVARNCPLPDQDDSGGTEHDGLEPGTSVTVNATDYGTDTVSGVLIRATASEIAIQRRDQRAGNIIVHFPRAGFRVAVAK